MITCFIAYCHAFRNNKDFSPELLYLGAVILDSEIFKWILK